MEKGKNTDLLKLIHEHTHLKNEDGEDVPFFCFTHDIMDTVDLDMSEEEIAQVALDNGYRVYKAFPEETMVGGLILCAEGCPKEAIDKMYQDFYGEVPTIEEWPAKEEITEEKEDEIEFDVIDLEKEAQTGVEQFKTKIIMEAESRGATIDFLDNISPKRKDSVWYYGDIARIVYKNFEIVPFASGDIKISLVGSDDGIRSSRDLEDSGIFTDEQINDLFSSNSIYFHNGNWFSFAIKKLKSNTWINSEELGYDTVDNLDDALDIDFYIDTVIPDVIERYYRTSEDLNEEKKKDPRLAQAGVSGYNQPKRTRNHSTKSHIVVAKEGDEIKTIRFGEQGAETAGKPKEGESEKMKAKRKSFKARHAKNIAKGKMSAAYWANKIKW
jgi:hypothetical protein